MRSFSTLGKAVRMEKKDVRIQLVMSESELEALDEWRAGQRIWSRSEAIREAVRRMVSGQSDQSSEQSASRGKAKS